MSKEQDRLFFRNFLLSLFAIALMMLIFLVIAKSVGSNEEADAKMRASKVAKITEPVGKVTVIGEEMEQAAEKVAADTSAMAGEASGNTGKTVYQGLCVNCHGIPALTAMIPQTGDAAVWEARIAKGIDTLYNNAINGFTGDMGMMPSKGGNPNLSDDEVKAAVDYMLNQVQ